MHSLLITLSIISLQLGALPDETADSIQRKVIENRMKIDSAVFSIHFESTDRQFPTPLIAVLDIYYQDENNARSDMKMVERLASKLESIIDAMGIEITNSPGVAPSETIISCFGNGKHYDYISGSGTPGFALTMQDAKNFRLENKANNSEADNTIIDPKVLGIIPNQPTLANRYNLNSYIGSEASKNGTVEKGIWKGKSCYIVTFNSGKSQIRYWVVPEMDYSVISIERKYPLDKLKKPSEHDRTRTEYQKDTKSGIWFPKKINFKRLRNGTIRTTEYASIKLVSLNEPIDPEVFSLNGIGITPGARVRNKDLKEPVRKIWDGEKVVDVPKGTPRSQELAAVCEKRMDPKRIVIIAVGFIFVLLSIVLAVRKRRAKKGLEG
jgi:hypothetical protein